MYLTYVYSIYVFTTYAITSSCKYMVLQKMSIGYSQEVFND